MAATMEDLKRDLSITDGAGSSVLLCCTERYVSAFVHDPVYTVRQLGFLKTVFNSIKASERAMEILRTVGEPLAIDSGEIPDFIYRRTKVRLTLLRLSSRGPTLSLDLNDKISFSMYNAPNARGDGPQVRLYKIKLTVLDRNRQRVRVVINVRD